MAYTNPLLTEPVTEQLLRNHHCWENVDRVSGDPETTKFKRTARLLQALWRESKGLPIGSQPTSEDVGSSDGITAAAYGSHRRANDTPRTTSDTGS